MNGTSPRFLKAIPLVLLLLIALVCPAFAEDYLQTAIDKANSGDPVAQYNLGFAYYSGFGVTQDYAEAVKWFRKAAEQEHAEAQFMVGFAYYSGRGVPQDYAETAKWYQKAAEQGYAAAQYNRGAMYFKGQARSIDILQSYFWFSLAASSSSGNASKEASGARDQVAKYLTPENIVEAKRMTTEWEKSHPRK